MAGGYTHLTLVRSAITEATNDRGTNVIPALAAVLSRWGHYVYLGGVSPDYPYLGLDAEWADAMHKGGTDRMIKHAMPILHERRRPNPQDYEWQRQFAWLLGFVSHVVADVTIHPVVNIRVGKYELNQTDHRLCEMTQDVWIYRKITGLDLDYADNMKGEIRKCGTGVDLHDGVEELWSECLGKVYGAAMKPGEDQIDRWHAMFIAAVDFAEKGRKIPLIGRHMAGGAKAYPGNNELDKTFYENLVVPVGKAVRNNDDPNDTEYQQPSDRGQPSSFEDIFDKACRHILEAWNILSEDMFKDDQNLGLLHTTRFGDWSLDTGVDKTTGKLRLWPWDEEI